MTIRTKTNSLQEVSTSGITWSNDRHEIEKCFSTDTVDRRRPDTGGTHNRRGGGSNTPLPYKVVALTHAHARERTTVAEQWEPPCEYSGFNWSTIGTQVVASRFMTRSDGKVKLSTALSLSLTHSDERTRHGQSSLRSHWFRLGINGKRELFFTAYLFWVLISTPTKLRFLQINVSE